jgi:hypothetical protein
MRSKRMLMGAAVIGCVAATTMSGAYAQEANTTGQFNVRSGGQPAINGQPTAAMRDGQGADTRLNARTTSNRTSAGGQSERRGFGNEARTNVTTREGRDLAGERRMRSERGAYARADIDGGYRGWRGGERAAYRDRAVGVGAGVAAADYRYRTRRLYAYAPNYDARYTADPYYNDAPGYDVAVTTDRYYAPAWNVAYAGPYYDYAPGVSFGIGIGPVGIGFGPAWGW